MAFFQFVEKKGWRTFTARMYGWGASMVIIGALFKLQHWPFAGYMLTIGMGIECIIFFFSAFDPLPMDYHWDTVFPELGDGYGAADKAAISAQKRKSLEIDADSADNLKRNVERFNQSLSSLGALATVAETSNRFVGGLQQAAGNMTVLNQTAHTFAVAYNETAQTIMAGGQQANVNLTTLNQTTQAFANAYNETAKTIAASGQQASANLTALSQTLANAYNETAKTITAGGQQASANLTALSQTTQTFANVYNETAKTITAGGQQANTNLAALNKNLQAVNTSYELYMQEQKGYVEHNQKLLAVMDNSAKQTQQFDRQMIELNKLIAELNTVYTSVVNTVNTTLKKR
ncbi:MAG: gliding motility protein GldL [Prevotellaceae bacterium]|jgi:gliding motility-associated protein GldL|nr:gliding motility protein GldL [Prevotellaceae bacterium]